MESPESSKNGEPSSSIKRKSVKRKNGQNVDTSAAENSNSTDRCHEIDKESKIPKLEPDITDRNDSTISSGSSSSSESSSSSSESSSSSDEDSSSSSSSEDETENDPEDTTQVMKPLVQLSSLTSSSSTTTLVQEGEELSNDIFDDIMESAVVAAADAITNNHIDSNHELLDKQEELISSSVNMNLFDMDAKISNNHFNIAQNDLIVKVEIKDEPADLDDSTTSLTDLGDDLNKTSAPSQPKTPQLNGHSADPTPPKSPPAIPPPPPSTEPPPLPPQSTHPPLPPPPPPPPTPPSSAEIESQKSSDEITATFDVIDELPPEDSSTAAQSPPQNPNYSTDEDDEFIDEMIDAPIDAFESRNKNAEELEQNQIEQGEEKVRMVLDDRRSSSHNFFDILPEGWVSVMHHSGMPIYLHRLTRVISLSRPYHIGTGSVKQHWIPVHAIPCLSYKRSLEEEAKVKERRLKEEKEAAEKVVANGGDPSVCPIRFPKANVLSIEEATVRESMRPDAFREFCKQRFIFKELRLRKFRNWSDRRKFIKNVNKKNIKEAINAINAQNAENSPQNRTNKDGKKIANTSHNKFNKKGAFGGQGGISKNRHVLPEGTKVLSVPVIELEPIDGVNGDRSALNQKITKKTRKEWVINPVGKSTVCILHEYIQTCLKSQPTYKFCEMESASTPYGATVMINDMEYGKGFGTSKKMAKNEAARLTLEILIPEMKNKLNLDNNTNGNNSNDTNSKSGTGGDESKSDKTKRDDDDDSAFFDDIAITDPRVSDFCNRTSEPSPYSILLTCLQRNYGLGDTNVTTDLKPMRNHKNEFTMKVDKREVSVICRNKKDGKQLASQKLLQVLHPHITSWGSLLRLYGNRALRIQKAKKAKESEVTELQSRGRNSGDPEMTPSHAILEKLREEMRNLRTCKQAIVPLGKFVIPLNSTSLKENNTITEKIDL